MNITNDIAKPIELDELISTAVRILQNGPCDHIAESLQKLLIRLEENAITIAVAGQFKRGKSTLINAILGNPLLPTGILPITSAVTKISYGNPMAKVFFNDGRIEQIQQTELYLYLNEQNNKDNCMGVERVELCCPCEALKNGIILVDTPGVGSLHRHNTEAAYTFVKESDAVLFLLSIDSPINEIECDFLKSINGYASKLYFAVNKIDAIEQSDVKQYLIYCQDTLQNILDAPVRLFPISAKYKDGVELLFSNIKSDINKNKSSILKNSINDKAYRQIQTALTQLTLYRQNLVLPIDELERKQQELYEQMNSLDQSYSNTTAPFDAKADVLIDTIGHSLNREKHKLLTNANETIDAYIDSKMTPKDIRHKLNIYLEGALVEINSLCLAMLNDGYQGMVNLLRDNIQRIHTDFYNLCNQILGKPYIIETTEYNLSSRDDYYVKVAEPSSGFLLNINTFKLFLPRRTKIAIIKREVTEQVEQNITNMLYNCRYKLRESKRDFESALKNESTKLANGITRLLEQIICDRNDCQDNLLLRLKEIDIAIETLKDLQL